MSAHTDSHVRAPSCKDVNVKPLVESTEEGWMELVGDCIAMWTKNSNEFLHQQQQKMLRMAKCPFLFGVTDNLPRVWIKVLSNYGLLDSNRVKSTGPMTTTDMETFEMVEIIFERCLQLVENKNDLKTILNVVNDVEERSRGSQIDMTFALGEVAKLEMFKSVWAPIKRSYEKKKRQAQVAFIYFFKTVHEHIIFYGRDGMDKEQYVQERVAKKRGVPTEASHMSADTKISEGNKAYNNGKYDLAFELYSQGLQMQPFNAMLYGNRAQTSIHLGEYWQAVCDCKRGMAINPTLSKNYYRAARSYLALGQLEKAADMNAMCLEKNKDAKMRKQIETQGSHIEDAKRKVYSASPKNLSIHYEHQNEINRSVPFQAFLPERDEGQPAGLSFLYHLSEGSAAYQSSQYTRAQDNFQCALKMVTDQAKYSKSKRRKLGLKEDPRDLTVLKYVCGKSSMMTGNSHNILSAIDKFQGIIKETDSFPAAFYGLGAAFLYLRRYKEALDPVSAGLDAVQGLGDADTCFLWPQSDQVIEETQLPRLKAMLKELHQECLWPPKPDAVCLLHFDMDHLNREIYTTDPDYKGHVSVWCYGKCCMDLHASCWKMYKSGKGEKVKDRDMIDTPCPTPNCWGSIISIYIHKVDSDRPVKLVSSATWDRHETALIKPRIKIRTDNPDKLKKKFERKRVKREKKEEARLAKKAQETPIHVEEEVSEANPVLMKPDQLVELRKDSEVLLERKLKSSKVKKKKDKKLQVLQVDFGFAGDEGKELLGAHSLDDDGDIITTAADMKPGLLANAGFHPLRAPLFPTPGLYPNPYPSPRLTGPVSNCLLPNPTLYNGPLDQQKEGLFQFFRELLKSSGPIELEGPEISEALARISVESQQKIFSYGGLANFLRSRINFYVLDDVWVCNREDQLKAEELRKKKLEIAKAALVTKQTLAQKQAKAFSWEQRAKELELKRQEDEDNILKSQGKSRLNPTAREFKSNVQCEGYQHDLTRDSGDYPELGAEIEDLEGMSDINNGVEEKENLDDSGGEGDDGFITVTRKKGTSRSMLTSGRPEPACVSSKTLLGEVNGWDRHTGIKSNSSLGLDEITSEKRGPSSMMGLDDFNDVPSPSSKMFAKSPVEDMTEDWVNGYTGDRRKSVEEFVYPGRDDRSIASGTPPYSAIDSIDESDDCPRPRRTGLHYGFQDLQSTLPGHRQSPIGTGFVRSTQSPSHFASSTIATNSSIPAPIGTFPKPIPSPIGSIPKHLTTTIPALTTPVPSPIGTGPASKPIQKPDCISSRLSSLNGLVKAGPTADTAASQLQAPKPLKATTVTLPTRGKKRLKAGLRLGRAAHLGQRAPSSSGSLGSGLTGEDEDQESQTSDRGSEGSEPHTKTSTPVSNNIPNSLLSNPNLIPSQPNLNPPKSNFTNNQTKLMTLAVLASSQSQDVPSKTLDATKEPFQPMGTHVGDQAVESKSNPFGIGSGLSSIWGNKGGFGSVGDSPNSETFDRSFFNNLDEDKGLSSTFLSSYEPSDKYPSAALDDSPFSSSSFGVSSQSQTSFNMSQYQPRNSLQGSRLAKLFGSTGNDTMADSGTTTNSVSSVEVGSGRPVSLHNPLNPLPVSSTNANPSLTNTFPSLEDISGAFLPNDLLSSSSSTSVNPTFQQTPLNASSTVGQGSAYYYPASTTTATDTLASLNDSVKNPLSLSLKSPQHSSWTNNSVKSPELLSPGVDLKPPQATSPRDPTPDQDRGNKTKLAMTSVSTMTSLTCDTLDKLQANTQKLTDTLTNSTKLNVQLQMDKSEIQQLCLRQETSLREALTQQEEARLREARLEQSMKLALNEVEVLKRELAGLKNKDEKKTEDTTGETNGIDSSVSIDLAKEIARARKAEGQTLGMRHQLMILKLDWAVREGFRNLSGLQSILAKQNSPELKKKVPEWQSFIEECQRKKREINTTYKSQLEQLETGSRMDQLELVYVNPPPFPDPPLKSMQSSAKDDDDDSSEEDETAATSPTTKEATQVVSEPPGFQRAPSNPPGMPPGLTAPGSRLMDGPAATPSPGLSKLLAAAAGAMDQKQSRPLLQKPASPLLRAPSTSPVGRSLLRLPRPPRLQAPPGLPLPPRQPPTFDRLVTSVQQTYSNCTRKMGSFPECRSETTHAPSALTTSPSDPRS